MIDLAIGIVAGIFVSCLTAFWAWYRGKLNFSWKKFIRSKEFCERMLSSGFSNFYASRSEYAKYREQGPDLTDYLRSARRSIQIAAYWVAQGVEIENVNDVITDLIKRKNIKVTIALIDPTSPYIDSLADYLGIGREEIEARVKAALEKFYNSKEASLSKSEKRMLKLKLYRTLPIASVIIIDGDDENGRIQIDIKPYRTPRSNSFTFELSGKGKQLYDNCLKSWTKLIENAEDLDYSNYFRQ